MAKANRHGGRRAGNPGANDSKTNHHHQQPQPQHHADLEPPSIDGPGSRIDADFQRGCVVSMDPVRIVNSDRRYSAGPYIGYFPPRSASTAAAAVPAAARSEQVGGGDCYSMAYLDNSVDAILRLSQLDCWQKDSRLQAGPASSYSSTRASPPTGDGSLFTPDATEGGPANRGWKIVDIKGKGLGIMATTSFKAGQLIICERPIFVTNCLLSISEDLIAHGHPFRLAAAYLNKSTRTRLMELANSKPNPPRQISTKGREDVSHDAAGPASGAGSDDTRRAAEKDDDRDDGDDDIEGRLMTNMLNVPSLLGSPTVGLPQPAGGIDSSGYGVCCPTISRINHSCVPNVNYYLQSKTFMMEVRAMCDIKAGEEFTLAYCDILNSKKERLGILERRYGFTCDCPACNDTPSSSSPPPPPIASADKIPNNDKDRAFLKDIVLRLDSIACEGIPRKDIAKALILAEKQQVYHIMPTLWFGGARNGANSGCLQGTNGSKQRLEQQEQNGRLQQKEEEELKWIRKARMWYTIMQGEEGADVQALDTVLGMLKRL